MLAFWPQYVEVLDVRVRQGCKRRMPGEGLKERARLRTASSSSGRMQSRPHHEVQPLRTRKPDSRSAVNHAFEEADEEAVITRVGGVIIRLKER